MPMVMYSSQWRLVSRSNSRSLRIPDSGLALLLNLNHIEVSPYGLHGPELDENLSFEGLIIGDFGQFTKI